MPRNLTRRFFFMFVYIQKDEEEVISDQDQKVVDSCAIQVMNVYNTWTSWYTTNNNRVSFLILHEALQHGGLEVEEEEAKSVLEWKWSLLLLLTADPS